MTSQTTSKKEIVDYLWEWALPHSDWGKLLIQKIVVSEQELIPEERKELFNYFLNSQGLLEGLPQLKITKPNYAPTSKTVILKSLSNIKGVNRLAKNQHIEFSENLTTLYGHNGTGKTGYSRILRAVGFSYENPSVIHPNIYGNTEPKHAEIKYKVDDVESNFVWNGENTNADLENISIFNSNCVQISLTDDRQLIVSPIGFHLFNLVSNELKELEKLLDLKITELTPTTDSILELLNEGTDQYSFVENLSAKSDLSKLDELSKYNPDDEKKIVMLDKELKSLNSNLLETEIKTLGLQINEINNIIAKIRSTKSVLTRENWEKTKIYTQQLSALRDITKKGLSEIAEANGIKFYESEAFSKFIKAADEYIKLLDKPDYPFGENEKCIYCQQPLVAVASIELLDNYRKLLNDDTEAQIKKIESLKKTLDDQILGVESSLTISQSTFGLDTNNQVIQPQILQDYNTIVESLKTIVNNEDNAQTQSEQEIKFNFDYEIYLKFFTDKLEKLQVELKTKRESLVTLSEIEEKTKKELSALSDKKILSEKKNILNDAIQNLRIISQLDNARSNFNTSSISRKTTDARDNLIRENFEEIFLNELKSVRRDEIPIELDFGTKKGQSQVYQKLNKKYLLKDILSEGEQKAIALAEFLTELQLDNSKAPVIFDDPVNSLDHRIIDDVARRLVRLSADRQVIILTHSILLFNCLIQQSELETNKHLSFKLLNVRNQFNDSGIIEDAEEINSFKYYKGQINMILLTEDENTKESDLAVQGYENLRAAIELVVERDIFKDTVKRYRRNVALTSFLRVDGNKLEAEKEKLNEIFERACGYIKGHSNPTELVKEPTIEELRNDFNEIMRIRDVFVK
jgi:hypothetical protein